MKHEQIAATALAFAALDGERRARELARMTEAEARASFTRWQFWARPGQLPPEGDWRVWLMLAGRGFGKTRAGAEWVRAIAEADGRARIALVGATLAEARAVMVEGESGLLAIAPRVSRPVWEPSLRRLRWPGGAVAMVYSAGEPEALRGPQHSHASGPGAEGAVSQRSAGPYRCCAAPGGAIVRRQ